MSEEALRANEERELLVKKMADYVIMAGLSMILSFVLTNLIQDHTKLLFEFFSGIQIPKFFYLEIAAVIFIQGIILKNNPKLVWLSKRAILIRFSPYFIFIAYFLSMMEYMPKEFGTIEFIVFIIINTIMIYAILIELLRVIKSLFQLLNKSVSDSKDRLSIIITIIATIISMIALFK